jgi:hypothetical protein
MKRFGENMKRSMAVLVLLLLFLTTGCASMQSSPPGSEPSALTWEQKADLAYTGAGILLSTGKVTIEVLAQSGNITTDQYAKFNAAYEKADGVYRTIGQLLDAAKATADAAVKKTAIEAYQVAMEQLPPLILEITKLVSEFQEG